MTREEELERMKKIACNDCLFNVQIEHEALELAAQILGDSEIECTNDFDSPNCWSKQGSCKDCWRDHLMKKGLERVKEKQNKENVK